MTSPILKLEEQLADVRSDQIAYKLTIENPDVEPIRLLAVEPRVPLGASLLEITDTSLAQANSEKADLIESLNTLLLQFLWVTSATFRQIWIERQKEVFKELSSVTGFFNFYFEIFFNTKSLQTRMKREFESFKFKITSAADARSAFEKWLKDTTEHEAIKTLFEEKTKQLERIEERMDERDRPGLTLIQSNSFFSATYVIKFSRHLFEPRKYQIGFDATYSSIIEHSVPQSNSVGASIQISPYPLSVTFVTIAGALLGVLIRISLSGNAEPLQEMLRLAQSGQILVGPIVALIFFNVYEYTKVGKDLNMAISWRSALLIGSLCGISQDRILAALKALIGA